MENVKCVNQPIPAWGSSQSLGQLVSISGGEEI